LKIKIERERERERERVNNTELARRELDMIDTKCFEE
jgi:hypothetical protein